MPTPLKHSSNQRKHLTKAEKEARQEAEAALESGKAVYLPAPKWLSEEARKVFEATKGRLKSFNLLEPVDIDLLAMYADAVAKYLRFSKTLSEKSNVREIQTVQAWSRIALTYADKLGFSQTARARLARRKAQDDAPVDPMDALLGEVNDFVNGAGTAGDAP